MKHPILPAGFILFALGSSALAQVSNIERFERQMEQFQRDTRLRVSADVPADQRALLDYGGYISLGYFAIDDIQQDMHNLRQYDLVGYARLNIDNVHEFFIRARMGYRDFDEGESFDGGGDETTWPTVEQAYYRFDLARYLAAYKGKSTPNNIVGTIGREFIYWANGLVLAATLDGAHADFTLGNFSAILMGGVTSHDTVDFDSSRPQFDDRTERLFYGGMASLQLGKHKPFIYGLVQHDQNNEEILVVGNSTTKFDYNSWYIGAGSNGAIGDRMVYGVEFAYEGGDTLSNSFDSNLDAISQDRDDIEAWALDVRLDYLLADAKRTRFTGEAIFACGDDDRFHTSNTFGGNQPGSTDNSFNAFGLLNTGLAFSPVVSNIIVVRGGASTFPFSGSGTMRRMQLGADVLGFFKMDSGAPIDELTTDDSYLGVEPDIYMNWQITSDLTLAVRYGVFFPGSAIVSDEHPRNFFFAGLTFAF